MTYPELAAVTLACVSVLVTILGIFIAIITIWGYTQLKGNARSAAINFLEEELQKGKLKKEIESIVNKHISKALSAEEFRELLRQRVDRLLISDAQSRANDKDLGQKPDENKEYGE